MNEVQKTRDTASVKTSLYEKLLEAGVPNEEIGSHYSDLYVLANKKNQAIISTHFDETGGPMPKTFRSCDESPSRLWYDIPFEYMPFWDAVDE